MRSRRGFTLVEMLVAMALTIFVMVILSQAFVTALQGFRELKGLGDMQARLRTAATILRRDLAADHFEGRRRLSDANFWNTALGGGPPREGFFRLYQGVGAGDAIEPTDPDGMPSRRKTGHVLHFTVKTRGNNRQDFFSATVPTGSPLSVYGNPDARYQTVATFNSQWAEVAYFLWRDPALPLTAPPGANGTPLFALYRRQRLAVPDNNKYNWGPPGATVAYNPVVYGQISIAPTANPNNPGKTYFNSPMDLTIPQRRFGMNPAPGSGGLPATYAPQTDFSGNLTGNDLVLSNVLSFDVQVIANPPPVNLLLNPAPPPLPRDLVDPALHPSGILPSVIFDTWSTATDDVYDYSRSMGGGGTTWTTTAQPPPPSLTGPPFLITARSTIDQYLPTIKALSITIRVWDPHTEQTRQITIVQDL
jgi:prepilin-type N-terminal cleavage/methylation domain-containing protein